MTNHYDTCRPGYCPGCGAAPGNIKNGVCEICGPRRVSFRREVERCNCDASCGENRYHDRGTPGCRYYVTQEDVRADRDVRRIMKVIDPSRSLTFEERRYRVLKILKIIKEGT